VKELVGSPWHLARQLLFWPFAMNWFLRGMLRALAWTAIFGGSVLAVQFNRKLLGEALVAFGFATLTVVTFIARRIRIYCKYFRTSGYWDLSADETPICFMVVVAGLFLISCFISAVAIRDLIRQIFVG
jgi:hypothetical protein